MTHDRKRWFAATSAIALALGGLSIAAPQAHALVAQPLPGASAEAVSGASLLQRAAYDRTVYEIQKGLNDLGYDAGPEDGLMGSRTRSAIRQYERDHDLLVTGNASSSLNQSIQSTIRERRQAQSQSQAQASAQSETTLDIQSNLRRLGYDVTLSGRADSKTQAAIEDYQRANNLLVTGQTSEALLTRLRQTPTPSSESGSETNQQLLTSIQSQLRQRGYKMTTITGSMNSETESAIRDYQRDQGLLVTGVATQALLDHLQKGQDGGQQMTRREQIMAVQKELNARGYSAGTADGTMGASTRNAIRTYQSDSGLPITGDLSSDLMAKLGIGASAGTGGTAEEEEETEVTFVTRLQDNFSDGNHDRSPSWQVLAGQFQVDKGKLKSSVTQPERSTQEQIGRSIIGGVLQQALGVRLPGAKDSAAIAQSTSVSNEFHMTAELTGQGGSPALVNLGFYQGNEASSGYRLVYLSDESRPLRLVAAEGQSSSLISSYAPSQTFNDGKPHKIDWTRDADGQMKVTVDGSVVMQVTDNRFTSGFDGFSFINGGGTWTLDDLKVESPQG